MDVQEIRKLDAYLKKLFGNAATWPLDAGANFFDGRPVFGRSKTVRGLVLAVVLTAAAAPLLGLEWWIRRLPHGLGTRVGERGDSLSVGERQFVALARAQIGDPGLLILDEATSAVDPETERALAEALARLARGRTTITIAHRMSTAEQADEVLVFREGRIAERGTHAQLVAEGGLYASLFRTWLGERGDGERREREYERPDPEVPRLA